MLLGSLGWEEAGCSDVYMVVLQFCTVLNCLRLGAENIKYSHTTVMSRYQK
jgi:hypothetical protein